MCSVNYPFPPNLKYKYPPASMKVFKNIMNAMASVPKFYEQVLHLMNKMNLPPPFEEDLPGPEWVKLKRKREDLASDESELESEEEKPLSPVEPPSASIENNEQFKNQFISIETLTLNRVHIEEIIAIPAFKNYVPGNPSSTLYIKNISKKATEADLLFIFGRYFDSQSELKYILLLHEDSS